MIVATANKLQFKIATGFNWFIETDLMWNYVDAMLIVLQFKIAI